MTNEQAWPPPVGARVRAADGLEFEVVAHFHQFDLGTVVVLQRDADGLRQSRPIDAVAWARERFEVVDHARDPQ